MSHHLAPGPPSQVDQKSEARPGNENDWTKESDLAERRRIQNRIAQRNYRKKLKRRLEDLERKFNSEGASTTVAESTSLQTTKPTLSPARQSYFRSDLFDSSRGCEQKSQEKGNPVFQLFEDLSIWPVRDPNSDESDGVWSSLSEATEQCCIPLSSSREVHHFRRIKEQVTRECLQAFALWRQCPSGSKKRSTSPPPPQASPLTKRAKGAEKKSPEEEDNDNDWEDRSNAKPHRTSDEDAAGTTRKLVLACPFYKEDPLRHLHCLKIELKRIKDVKQHLSRKHRQPSYYCPTCWLVFDHRTDRDSHISHRSCLPKDQIIFEGISDEQRELFSQKVDRRLSEEQQWFSVWDIVFPDVPRPGSAYLGNQIEESMVLIHDFWDANGRTLVADALLKRGVVQSSRGSEDEGEFRAFLSETLESVVEELLESCRVQIAATLSSARMKAADRASASKGLSGPEARKETQPRHTTELASSGLTMPGTLGASETAKTHRDMPHALPASVDSWDLSTEMVMYDSPVQNDVYKPMEAHMFYTGSMPDWFSSGTDDQGWELTDMGQLMDPCDTK
ncbi:HET and ankyrin domain protein [Colletotrichum tofieldiae]|uniref:HET and ankyrin domain protein n=1 Tax=Colletotrichum tofieldiae TaxID=708197 RepID=A0A166P2R0_9PEZI|nr:HET and ankyrin domain protein [Colletotrichum tofieldiae]